MFGMLAATQQQHQKELLAEAGELLAIFAKPARTASDNDQK